MAATGVSCLAIALALKSGVMKQKIVHSAWNMLLTPNTYSETHNAVQLIYSASHGADILDCTAILDEAMIRK